MKESFKGASVFWPSLALALVLTLCGSTMAQQATARIIGTITDQQGAIVPGAKVTVTNVATKVATTVISDKDGAFQALDLPIGTYQVSVEHEGFKTAVSPTYTLEINQVQRVDLKMEVGQVSETVQVSAGASVVETINSTLGESVTARPLVNLPLNGRNTLDLALLQPGVTDDNPDDTGAGTFNIAGARADSVTFLLDGGNDNDLLSNGVVYSPNPDAVQEFRILKSDYSAEYGRNAGGIVSLVLKSGTNSIHGSAYDFLRNDALNANSFFNNVNGLPRNVLKRNQFGFTLGGPIDIPKVINGKDRFFWFFSYQGQRQSAEDNSTTTTFTPAELAGDFSRSANGGPDPGVVKFLQANPFFQPDAGKAAQGIIDPARIDPIAQNYIKNNLIPTAPNGTLATAQGATDNRDDINMKFDLSITPNDRLSISLARINTAALNPFSTQSNVPGYPTTRDDVTYFGNVAYTRTFTNNVLNEFRITAQRVTLLNANPAAKLPTPADLGVGVTPDNPTGPTGLSFIQGLSTGFSVQGPTHFANTTYGYSDTLSWIKGKHTMTFGAGYSPYQNNTVFDFFVDGVFFFNGPFGIGSGNSFADFLFGLPDQYLQFGQAPSNIRTKSVHAFGQDEWHVTPHLTLTLGLRYEYNSPKLDTQGRSFSLVQGAQSQRFVNAPRGLVFPGDPGAPEGANFPDKNDFAPRFGFAWDPRGDGKMSIRGGFGVFYDILKGEDNLQFNGQAPFFGFAFLAFNPPTSPIGASVNILSDPFVAAGIPNSFPSKPPAPNIDFAQAGFIPFGGGGVFFVDPHLRTPYVYQYFLSVEREAARNLLVKASYVGSSARKLTSLVDANPMVLGTNIGAFDNLPRGMNFSFLPEFQNVSSAHYNSLELSVEKRLGESKYVGTTYFKLAYTLAHSFDNSSGFRNRNSQVPAYQPGAFYSSSDFDVRQRLVFSGGWDLPFGNAWKSGPKRLTTGWSLYPIVSWRTGFPLDIFAGIPQTAMDPGPSGDGDPQLVRANLNGASVTQFNPKAPQTFAGNTGNYWFNPGNFNINFPSGAPFTFGTLPRNFFRGPGRTNFDLAIAKTTFLSGERVSLEFRAEFFNIFNQAQFLNPDTIFNDGTFGQILGTYDPRIIQFALRLKF